MAKLFTRLYQKKNSILLIVFFCFAFHVKSQDFLDFKLQTFKDENAWNFYGDLQGRYQLTPNSTLKLSNRYNSRKLLPRNIWQEDNYLVFLHNYFFNPTINLDTEFNSKTITNEESYQQFSQHVLDFKPRISINPKAIIEPIGGVGISFQKDHEDTGWVYGLNARGELYRDEESHSSFVMNSMFGDFGPRSNRRYDVNIFWSQKFSHAAADSFSVGTFYNYNENYITRESLAIESFGKETRYVRNLLFYDFSASLKTRLYTNYEWKNLDRINELQRDQRTEYALENRWNWIYVKPTYTINWNVRFRNEQRKGLNTAINSDTRLTSFQIQGNHRLFDNHFLKYNLYLSKYETDTPSSVQQDRDELRWIIFTGYRWQPSPLIGLLLQGEVSKSHQMYLFARYSNNNYQNQIYRIKTGITIKPIQQISNTLLIGIESNYNIFDFESLDEILRSRLVKTWSISDTLQYHFSKNTTISYIFIMNNVQLGSFDPEDILFYRNMDRITQQHQFRIRYFWQPAFTFAFSGIFYNFDQLDPVNNFNLVNNQYNFIPQIDISFFPSRTTQVHLFTQMVNNRVTFYEPDIIITERVFLRARLRVDYLF